jgi:hypothetical protein
MLKQPVFSTSRFEGYSTEESMKTKTIVIDENEKSEFNYNRNTVKDFEKTKFLV